MTGAEIAFTTFGLATQALLLAFFAARRWWAGPAGRLGPIVYLVAALGLPLALALLIGGQSPSLVIGPLLLACWAGLGTVVDLWRPRDWRGPPVVWTVLAPYLALYFWAQMFLWWPLWNIERAAWVAFLLLFVPSTALNIRGHVRE